MKPWLLNWTAFIVNNTHAEIDGIGIGDEPEWYSKMFNLWLKNSDYGKKYKEHYHIGDRVTTEYYYHGETFTVVGIRENELELRGDWSGGTHNVDQSSWYPIEKCKRKLNC
jgi:hypothetical protein